MQTVISIPLPFSRKKEAELREEIAAAVGNDNQTVVNDTLTVATTNAVIAEHIRQIARRSE